MQSDNFINENEIWETIEKARNRSGGEVRDILQKASTATGLSLYETAVLLQTTDNELINEIYTLAKKIKETIYGNRIVIFVPLYISNVCSNICTYCGFRADNKELVRKTLTVPEIQEEVAVIEKQGHKRILTVFGENVNYHVDKMVEGILAIYATKTEPHGEIRRVNINAAPLSIEDFRVLKTANIGTYQCFQETYHRSTYEKLHIAGKKKDYLWRLNALHRAQEAGIDDVASGVLYGLFDPIFDTLALLRHSEDLSDKYGVGPHTISFPRLEPALGSDISTHPPFMVSDELFKRIVAVIRLAIPYTGMILSTRESPALRRELLYLGVSQISAGSKTSPGSYHESGFANEKDNVGTQFIASDFQAAQFQVADDRNLDEVIYQLASDGFIPSFCTACYRLGRQGEHFMDMAKNQHIKSFCHPNALLTFAEYLEDYASMETKSAGYALIKKYLEGQVNNDLCDEIEEVKKGARDRLH